MSSGLGDHQQPSAPCNQYSARHPKSQVGPSVCTPKAGNLQELVGDTHTEPTGLRHPRVHSSGWDWNSNGCSLAIPPQRLDSCLGPLDLRTLVQSIQNRSCTCKIILMRCRPHGHKGSDCMGPHCLGQYHHRSQLPEGSLTSGIPCRRSHFQCMSLLW